MNQIEELQQLINNANHIVVITGAGISTASGIPDIRSANGAANNKDLLKKYKYGYETIVSHTFFMERTDEFYRYYKEVMIFKYAKPNIAHKYLAKLEQRKDVTIITQNIDGLHTVAGSKKVIEFHGSTQRNTCMDCGEKYSLEEFKTKYDDYISIGNKMSKNEEIINIFYKKHNKVLFNNIFCCEFKYLL